MQLAPRSVDWTEGQSPRVSLPPEKLREHGIEHTDQLPLSYDAETGELTYHLGEVGDA
jgi:hypothetical protein